MTTATKHSPEKTALARASSYNEGRGQEWKWYFFSEESEGVFNGFVKSPFCPEGEYGLIMVEDLRGFPFIHIEMNPLTDDYLGSLDLFFKISKGTSEK
jgi:hypothetical protein